MSTTPSQDRIDLGKVVGDGIPAGGTAGQVLTKTEAGTAWKDPTGTADRITESEVDSKISTAVTGLASTDYVDTKTAGTLTAINDVSDRVDANEQAISDLQTAMGDTSNIASMVDSKISTAIGALDKTDTEISGQFVSEVSQTDGLINVKRQSLPDYSNVFDAKGSADTVLQSAKYYADTKDTAIQSAQKKADDATDAVNQLSDYVGDIPADSEAETIIQYIDTKSNSASYDDTEIKNRVSTVEKAVDALNGTGDGSVSKTVADAIAAVVADAPESLDTLKEISDWITNHSSNAAEMNTKIEKNSSDIKKLQDLIGELPESSKTDTLVDYINKVVSKSSGDVSAEDFNAAVARVTAIESEITDARLGYDGTQYKSIGDTIRAAQEATADIAESLDKKFKELEGSVPNGLSYEGEYLQLVRDGEGIGNSVHITGGGSSNTQFTVTLTNNLESRVISAVAGTPVVLSFDYSSEDDAGNNDGSGVGSLTVNGLLALNFAASQGTNTIDVVSYLVNGENSVIIKVMNSEGISRSLSYTVNVTVLTVTTTFSEFYEASGQTTFYYTVTGTGSKTVYFEMDGVQIGSTIITTSGRSNSFVIPEQSIGGHVFKCWCTLDVGGSLVQSNVITIGMMYTSATMTNPIVLTTFDKTTSVQGDILAIPYSVYDPASETASVALTITDSEGLTVSAQNITVDRTPQTWTVTELPAGNITLKIQSKNEYVTIELSVTEYDLGIYEATDALGLNFNPYGRSNNEDNPATWASEDGEIVASFSGIGFIGNTDGWVTDDDNAAILRVLPGGTVNIPYEIFATDARTTGKTIEVEMSTHNVMDYDTVVLSALSGGRGLKIASQSAELKSEQSQISMQFKEDEKIRVSFVIEPTGAKRLVYVYVDAIMCGVIQYPTLDDFSQVNPVGITIGAETSGIDIYRIRVYEKHLTTREILDNFTVDRALLADRILLKERNDITDSAGLITYSKLPSYLPYMIVSCPELPQFKGDKKTCDITYVNSDEPGRSFTASSAQIDVQGTSSAGYKKKNFKIKFKSGLTYSSNQEQSPTYKLRADSIPADTFCMKADVASSEGANNVELIRLYEDTVPYDTPPQENDSRVRVGIDGLPCVIFWRNSDTNETVFWGKYNFNNDKSTEATFGLTLGCESWEIKNNTSPRVVFKVSDYSDSSWLDDFEARYPEDNTDYTNLKIMTDWVVSTDRAAATGKNLPSSVSIDGTTYTKDTAEYRLAKFKDEFDEHFVRTPMLYYYLWTEVFLMVDSRAKNLFPSTFDGIHWLPLPYDADTALGINNEGQLVFDYDLEDTDTVDGANVFNGQDSVLWNNVRDAFPDELASLYNNLRNATTGFNYADIIKRFANHQATWPETVWNEDAWEKYLEPLEADNDSSYLAMLQGNKASQREWWLYNGMRYRDSKYQCGDASAQYITLRCYSVGDITVTPYSHIWPRIRYGSYTVSKRAKRNETVTLENPLSSMNDTEVYIYSADRLIAIGDLSPLQVGYANFSMAKKLQSLKLGDDSPTYTNTRLTELYVGNNELLTLLDVSNCVNLASAIDLSECVNVETIKAKGSAITGLGLPVGGKIKSLELPGTIANLTLRNQTQFESLDISGVDSLTTLRVENTPNVPLEDIVKTAENLNRVRIINQSWEEATGYDLQETFEKLKACIGMDAAGNNVAQSVVTGYVNVLNPTMSAEA